MPLTVSAVAAGFGLPALEPVFQLRSSSRNAVPPLLVIEWLAADQGQKTQGLHRPEMILKHRQPFCAQSIIFKGIRHGFVPPNIRQGFGPAPPAARAELAA
jgi:hypothetical protein